MEMTGNVDASKNMIEGQQEEERQKNKLASSKLRQTVAIRNFDPLSDSLTGVKCRATSIAKNVEQSAMEMPGNVDTSQV